MNIEGTLLEKLRKLEALHAGTTVAGEREAASRAAERIRERLRDLRAREAEVVMRYSIADPWQRKLFVALCRRYGLVPYRERGRRHSTVLVRAPASSIATISATTGSTRSASRRFAIPSWGPIESSASEALARARPRTAGGHPVTRICCACCAIRRTPSTRK
jgi:hypothetical protein